jgi:hypothetical protein
MRNSAIDETGNGGSGEPRGFVAEQSPAVPTKKQPPKKQPPKKQPHELSMTESAIRSREWRRAKKEESMELSPHKRKRD